MEKSWHKQLEEEFAKPYMQELSAFLVRERQEGTVYPKKEWVFESFTQTPFEEVKVVILGQDPYHGEGQAHGLSFSVQPGVKPPPSLKNIFLELRDDLGLCIPQGGHLLAWAKQGVFLLNASLTVRAKEPGSHRGKGWERFTSAVIQKLVERKDPAVFLLWGKAAEEKAGQIPPPHQVLIAAHPSPYSVKGFLGCRHFSKANEWLKAWGKTPIDWSV